MSSAARLTRDEIELLKLCLGQYLVLAKDVGNTLKPDDLETCGNMLLAEVNEWLDVVGSLEHKTIPGTNGVVLEELVSFGAAQTRSMTLAQAMNAAFRRQRDAHRKSFLSCGLVGIMFLCAAMVVFRRYTVEPSEYSTIKAAAAGDQAALRVVTAPMETGLIEWKPQQTVLMPLEILEILGLRDVKKPAVLAASMFVVATQLYVRWYPLLMSSGPTDEDARRFHAATEAVIRARMDARKAKPAGSLSRRLELASLSDESTFGAGRMRFV